MEKYYIGLDMGTDSVGWAVTDEKYNVPSFKGNAMWGVRLFEESQTAEERRNYRCQRRRTDRNKFRQECLEMLFNEELSKKDIAFFQRLKDSNLYEEDKRVEGRFSIFNDENYTDKDYHQQYPTIYHLRKELIDNPKPHDIRLIYLAISHIVKNRGHFLFDSDFNLDGVSDFESIWSELSHFCRDNYDLDIDCLNSKQIGDILKNKLKSKTNKTKEISSILGITKKNSPQEHAIISLAVGGTVKASDIFCDASFDDSECSKICLSIGYDEKESSYQSTFGEEFELIEKIKAVYDWSVLADILNNEKYLSYAKSKIYDEHKKDLSMLKSYVKEYCPKEYINIFKKDEKNTANYLAYSKHGNKEASPQKKNCTQEDFCKFLKSKLPKECKDEKYKAMYNKIELNIFMPKIVSKDNSVIPMQINRAELIKILDNAKEYFPFLNNKDKSGKTTMEKIVDIFNFRIPYYVGPLNSHSDKSWIERSKEKIYPWNFGDVVNIDKSAENFIDNLTSKCTYLPNEDVVPRESLVYSTFVVLNELNNLKLDGEKIDVKLKQDIYNDLFLKRNKVTNKALQKYIKDIKKLGDVSITGIDGDFKGSLKAYIELQEFDLTDSQKENIIKAITIFGDDKRLLKRRLKNDYGNILTIEEINKISRLKYKGWGRLSKKLLIGIDGVIGETGEVYNIIRAMWETNLNLMELLSKENTFLNAIEKEKGEYSAKALKEEINSLYVSPKIKRPINQAMQIVREIVKIKGCEPAKIFVEVARGKEEKKPTKSRKTALMELYSSCKKQEEELYKELEACSEADLRRDALYLYFTQMGRCMYTGRPIEIEDLFNRNVYDIDHIFPQSKLKDDSLNNRVLVSKLSNEEKKDVYPIKKEIRDKQKDFWLMLKNKGFIKPEKYSRLVRSTPLTDDELGDFINRQLVETRQSTKAVAELLKSMFPNSNIVYSKARNVSDFRQQFDMIKCRDVNDFHHAKDAYLNIVVGNVYNTLFSYNNRSEYARKLRNNEISMNHIFDYNVRGAWETKNKDSLSIEIVKKTMSKNNIRYTRYASRQKGGLFDQNILKKGQGQVPIKQNSPRMDIEKYGGYNRATSTYFAIAQYEDKKGKIVACIIPIDLYKEKQYIENPKAYLRTYIMENVDNKAKLDSMEILVSCLKYNSLISVNGFRMHISSKSGGGSQFIFKPAIQLVLSYKEEKYISAISHYLDKCNEYQRDDIYSPFYYLIKNSKIKKDDEEFLKMLAEKNISLYDAISLKLTQTIFRVKFQKVGLDMLNGRDKFESCRLKDQFDTLMQVLHIIHSNTMKGDLSLIGGAKNAGSISIGNKLSKDKDLKSFKIINQSVTGLYENEIEILR